MKEWCHRIVYLAGPVRAVGRTASISWRQNVARLLVDRDIYSYNPPGAWMAPHLMPAGPDSPGNGQCAEVRIGIVNDMALDISDLVLVAYHMALSEGTDHEIVNTLRAGKPLVVYALRSAGFEEWLSARDLSGFPVFRIGSEVEMVDHIAKVLS